MLCHTLEEPFQFLCARPLRDTCIKNTTIQTIQWPQYFVEHGEADFVGMWDETQHVKGTLPGHRVIEFGQCINQLRQLESCTPYNDACRTGTTPPSRLRRTFEGRSAT